MADSIVKFFDSEERPPRGGWTAEIDGRTFTANGESLCVDALRDYRLNNNTYTSDHDLRAELWAYWREREPNRVLPGAMAAAGFVTERKVASDGTRPAGWKESEGSKQWQKLHSHIAALVRQGSLDVMAELRFLEIFQREIGCEDCRRNWSLRIALRPPVLSTPDNYFDWSAQIHDDVNNEVGHAQFGIEAARALYNL